MITWVREKIALTIKIKSALPAQQKRHFEAGVRAPKKKLGKIENFLHQIKINTKGFFLERLSAKQQTAFAKRMSFLIKSGVPVYESLNILKEQTRSKKNERIMKALIKDVANGSALSTSMRKFPYAFTDFAINIIKVGESSGTLSQNFSYLADELKKADVLRKKVMGALLYPAIISVATFGITGMLAVYIFPKIMPVFTSMNITLPLTTRIMLWVSNFLLHHGIELIVGVIILLSILFLLIKYSKMFRYYFDLILLRIPIAGTLSQFYNLANCSRTLGLLLKSGLRLSEALPITAHTIGNKVYEKRLHLLSNAVQRGEKISVHLKKDQFLFPDIICQMVAVGEHSGSLSDSFIYLSDLYDNEVEDYTKNLSSLVEPVLMICMGILVGFMAVSVITPIYSITQHLQVR